MDYNGVLNFYPGYMTLPTLGHNAFSEDVGDIEGADGADGAAPQVFNFFDPRVFDENIFFAPLPPGMRQNHNVVFGWPGHGMHGMRRNTVVGNPLHHGRLNHDPFMRGPSPGARQGDHNNNVILQPDRHENMRGMRERHNTIVGDPLRDGHVIHDVFMGAPALRAHRRDNNVGIQPNRHRNNSNNFEDSFRPQTYIKLDLPTIPDPWDLELYDESDDIDNNDGDSGEGDVDEVDSDSDKTVSGWELDDEFVGLNYNDSSEVEDNAVPAPHDPQLINNMNGTALASHVPEEDMSDRDASISGLGDYLDPEFMHIAAMAPHAPRDGDSYSGNVGEILTHESWRRFLANIPPGEPLPGEERKSPTPESMLACAVISEVDTASEEEDEDDIYGATPPPVILDDSDDSDFDPAQAEADTFDHDDYDDDADDEDEDEDDDEGFVSGEHKRGPYRKAPSKARARARRQGKKSQGRLQKGSGMTLTSSHQEFSRNDSGQDMPDSLILPEAQATFEEMEARLPAYFSNKPQSSCNDHGKADSNVMAAPYTANLASPSGTLVSNGSSTEASEQEGLPQNWVEGEAPHLEKKIVDLRSDFELAEAKYNAQLANRLRDREDSDPDYLDINMMRWQIQVAVRERGRFERVFGPDNVTTTTGSDTAASSSDMPSAAREPPLLQVLHEEISNLKDTTPSLRKKVIRHEGMVQAWEDDPAKFSHMRVGFQWGRYARRKDSRRSLFDNLQLIEIKQMLYYDVYKKIHGIDYVEGLNGGQMQQQTPDKGPETLTVSQLQSSSFQTRSRRKRKASEMIDLEEEEEEEVNNNQSFPARSKPRLMPGTPV